MTETRHRRGEQHFRARVPFSVVEDARDMRDAGQSYSTIAWAIKETHGIDVPWRTVSDWVNYRTRISA